MANQNNKNQVKENVKDTAGAAFHNVHDALESTENAAMNTVDATANAVGKVTGASSNKKDEK